MLNNQTEISSALINFCLNKFKFIYISGNGGSGKTTFAKSLVKQLNSMNINSNYIDTDEFVLDAEIRKSAKKKWIDVNGNERISEYTTSFPESYYLPALKTIIYSLRQGKDCYYKPKKKNEFIELKAEFPVTIIEGVGVAFLEKTKDTIGLFFTCNEDVEIERRIQRARNGEDVMSYEEVRKKVIERNNQFNVSVLPNKSKFDIELYSSKDFNLSVIRDGLNIF